jgi:penicillin-binding protein 2
MRRTLLAASIVSLAVAVLVARLGYLQIVSHEHFSTLSDSNRVRLQPLAPTRGLIYDRNGVLLADNLPSFRLEIVPEEVDELQATLRHLGELVALEPQQLERFERQRQRRPAYEGVPLKLNLSDEETARVAVEQHSLPGVHVQAALTRYYPLGPRAVHLLGYVGRISEEELEVIDIGQYRGTTHIGKNGVEKAYEELLHGRVGYQQVETNAQGRALRVLNQTAPTPGHDLHLSVDIRLQAVAEDALGDFNGAVVAIDPRDGEILAMASQPGFDPNLFVRGIDSESFDILNNSHDRPLFNRALRGSYPPGSTIKPFLALAGLEYQVVDASTSVYCPGFYQLPNNTRRYRDWRRWGHGRTDLDKAVVESCDVFFYDLARNLGIERMHDFLARFGLGAATGIDIGSERIGLLPNERWKRAVYNQPWYTGETLIAGIGQGFMLTTPLQLAQATAILAGRGRAFVPHLLRAWKSQSNAEIQQTVATPWPTIELRDPAYWQEIIHSMTRVVHSERGTARRIGMNFPYTIAGKTGTAQVFSLGQDEEYNVEELEERLRDHALFVGFTPAEAPRLAVAVLVENGGSGGGMAAPVARAVMDAWLALQMERSRIAGEPPS